MVNFGAEPSTDYNDLTSKEAITSHSFLLNACTFKSREFVKDHDTYYEVQ